MNNDAERPDPDALLRLVQQEATRAQQGKLRIFFGFAPGVGKTYRMLKVARELYFEQHLDVMVGVVETHKRPETAALLSGLPALPQRKVEYRGSVLEELDLDAVLARKPKLVLVDELAHTNAEGSRHPKRYQDVLELLEAGIDVLSTMNVQHVESLNDVVAQITHVKVRETVPDSILERADELELVDIAPEELLARLKEGKVYLRDQAERAVEHFFRRGNLLALRELALRKTAERVDRDVLEYRTEHGVAATWPASERLLVCVGPAPSSARLVRATRRMAEGLHAPWTAVYVDAPGARSLSERDRAQLEAHLELAESLGGKVMRLAGLSISDALLEHARKHNVTRIVLGKPTHSRLLDLLRGSLLDEVVRGSHDIDVLVIAGDETEAREPDRSTAPSEPFDLKPYWGAFALIAATTGIAWAADELFAVPDLEVLYFVAIMLAAMRFGRRVSVLTSALAVAAYDFFFVQPHLTFAVADLRYLLTFAMMFGVGLVISTLTSRLRREEREASLREERTATLYALSRDLGAAQDIEAAAQVIARHAAHAFPGAAFVLRPASPGDVKLAVTAAAPSDATLDPKELAVASWAHEHRKPAGAGTDSLPGGSSLSLPLNSASSARLGVLALLPAAERRAHPVTAEQRALLEALCGQAALALERAQLAETARASALREKTEEVRGALLSAVSHDLRTPLATITGAATSLRDDANLSTEARADLLVAICEEAERLERLVVNLLDMTRIESGAVVLKREWVPLDEAIGAALARVEGALRDRSVKIQLPPDLPLVWIDPVLFQQVLVNLLENSLKYTPQGSAIEIAAVAEEQAIEIALRDHGPGFVPGSEAHVFDKFHRGSHVAVRGLGLGLSICKWIVDAHGGTIEASNRPEGGAMIRIRLPRPTAPAAVPAPPAQGVA